MGPVTSKSYFGGVAIFDENLALAFKKLGQRVIIVTNQSDKLKNKSVDTIYKDSIHTVEFVNSYVPDLVIASLTYVKYLPVIKSKYKIYYLHGFFNMSYYGQIKSILGITYQKLFLMNNIKVIANSALTKIINENIFNLRVDKTIYIGVSDFFVNYARKENESEAKKENIILYAGRLVKAKNVDKIIEAFKRCKIDATLVIAGDGEEKEKLIKLSRGAKNIKFTGQLAQNELLEYYKKAKTFISLNPTEPYGMSYAEALLLKDNIISPNSGGQVEYLKKYKDHVEFVDIDNIKNISNAMARMMQKDNIEKLTEKDFYDFSYDRTAEEILQGLKN